VFFVEKKVQKLSIEDDHGGRWLSNGYIWQDPRGNSSLTGLSKPGLPNNSLTGEERKFKETGLG